MALAGPVAADEAAIVDAWQGWVAETGVTRSALAITRDGVLLSDHGYGMQADAPVPLASLSKAVTGACVLSLAEEGFFGVYDTLASVFDDAPDLAGKGGDITISALLTHTSGLSPDSTQTVLNPSLWGAGDLHDEISDLALSRSVGAQVFFYNNENYAVLGRVIAHVTGQSVEQACAMRVLADQTTAQPDWRTGGSLAWGGWAMSVADYAQFATTLDPATDLIGASLGGGAVYGPGVFWRPAQDRFNLWHFGGFCLFGLGDHGSYFYLLENGWGVTVWYDICASGEQAQALDNALAQAAYSGG